MKKLPLQLLVISVVLLGAIATQAQSIYEPYWFGTLAGLTGNPGSADGVGRAARFNQPNGLAIDNAGNVYVADRQNNAIRKISHAGVVTTVASGPGVVYSPKGVAVDREGNIYTEYGCAIRKISPEGVTTTLAGEYSSCTHIDGIGGAARFAEPGSLALDNSGNLYVTENYGCTIRKVTGAGVVTTLAGMFEVPGSADGTGSEAQFQYPGGITVDSSGYVYVVDCGNQTIRKITPTGDVTTIAGAVHQTGNIDGVGSSARFFGPAHVAVDAAGNLFITDFYNRTIRKITPGRMVTTLGGLVGHSAFVDGTGDIARFQELLAIAVDGAGRLYITDNLTIRVGGVPSTLTDLSSIKGEHPYRTFPIHVALAGEPTVECRGAPQTGAHTLVFTFVRDIVSAYATVIDGVGGVAGVPEIHANQMSVHLSHVENAQAVSIAVTNIVDTDGYSLRDAQVTINFLLGDTNNDGFVNGSDVSQTSGQVGQLVTDFNYRSDVNADGVISAGDVKLVTRQLGNKIP